MRRYLPIIFLLASVAALAVGIVELFALRFEVGDVYPEYSSLRSDPLGTMAFYESLEKLPGFSVRRDFSTANRLPDGKVTTYFHLAAEVEALRQLSAATLSEIEQFVVGGGRLVITIFPQARNTLRPRNPDRKERPIFLSERWGVDFRTIALEKGPEDVNLPATVLNESGLPLPETLDWHSAVVFANLNQAWTPIYTRGTNPVVIERLFGRGSVVFATDSYFLSNEAMRKDRHADLLAWLIGSGRTVIFDEVHLGVTESPGVATLMWKYNLHGFLAGLILLAGLFIWMNSVSLVPPDAAGRTQDFVAGKDAAAGFDNLLRRSIPTRDLLATCFNEWKKSVAPTGKYSAARIQQTEAAFEKENSRTERDRDPIQAYRTIYEILRTKTK